MDHIRSETTAECPLSPAQRNSVRVLFLRALGLVCVGLGIFGAFVPLLPTTIFLIAAAWCFAYSAPAWRRRVLDHPRFGPPIKRFIHHGTLSRRSKVIAIGGIAANFLLSVLLIEMTPLAVATVAAVLMAVAVYIATRPEAAAKSRS